MFKRLLPKEYDFFDMFEKHTRECLTAAKLLSAMLTESLEKPIGETVELIKETEHIGDKITHATMDMLHRTFVTPFDRGEIRELIIGLDNVLDQIDETAQFFLMYNVSFPRREAKDIATLLVHNATLILTLLPELRTLKNTKEILAMCVAIKNIETQADALYREAVARLFVENVNDPLHVIKWKDIFESLEKAVDATEEIANIVEGIVIEHA